MKYNVPWFDDRTIVRPGAFSENEGKCVPILYDGHGPENVIGSAVLHEKEDGLYYEGTFNENISAVEAFIEAAMKEEKAFGLFANKLKLAPVTNRRRRNGRIVTSGNVVYFEVVTPLKDGCSRIETIDGKPVGETEEDDSAERLTLRDLKIAIDDMIAEGYSLDTRIISVDPVYMFEEKATSIIPPKKLKSFTMEMQDGTRMAKFTFEREGTFEDLDPKEKEE